MSKTGKTGDKISRKVPCTKSFKTFISLLINDINVMWEHLHWAHMQYRAYKKACIDAGITNESIATVHIDWSENARIRQAREEKGGGGYYYEDNISIHAMRIWETEGQSSVVSLSDSTYHGTEAVVASLIYRNIN